jgi:hypothetical protein
MLMHTSETPADLSEMFVYGWAVHRHVRIMRLELDTPRKMSVFNKSSVVSRIHTY